MISYNDYLDARRRRAVTVVNHGVDIAGLRIYRMLFTAFQERNFVGYIAGSEVKFNG